MSITENHADLRSLIIHTADFMFFKNGWLGMHGQNFLFMDVVEISVGNNLLPTEKHKGTDLFVP